MICIHYKFLLYLWKTTTHKIEAPFSCTPNPNIPFLRVTLSWIWEKAMATHSSTLAWKTPGRRSLEGFSPWGRWGSDTTERFHFHFSLSCIGEGNGNPLQYSYLENPRDGGAWWVAVYRVAQSRTRLKWLSIMKLIYISPVLLTSLFFFGWIIFIYQEPENKSYYEGFFLITQCLFKWVDEVSTWKSFLYNTIN